MSNDCKQMRTNLWIPDKQVRTNKWISERTNNSTFLEKACCSAACSSYRVLNLFTFNAFIKHMPNQSVMERQIQIEFDPMPKPNHFCSDGSSYPGKSPNHSLTEVDCSKGQDLCECVRLTNCINNYGYWRTCLIFAVCDFDNNFNWFPRTMEAESP